MKKRFFSLVLIIILVSSVFFGCKDEAVDNDRQIITSNTFKIGCLLHEGSDTSQQVYDGLSFANSLADSVNLDNETVSVECSVSYYSDSDDMTLEAQTLTDSGVSAIVYYAEDFVANESIASVVGESGIPAVSLGSYSSKYDNIFNLTISTSYMSSALATYATEKGYSNCAVLCETGDSFSVQFADTFKATYESYAGTEPFVCYKSGDLANYTPASFISGNYDCTVIICSDNSRKEIVTELRENGFSGEIIFSEILNKFSLEADFYDGCSFLSKLNEDNSNNISTMFYSMYSEYAGVKSEDVTSAVAYGYDAYMTIFEALKSFGTITESALFGDTDTQPADSAKSIDDIKLSDLKETLKSVVYYGVTDTVRFTDNQTTATYIYVDTVSEGKTQFAGKYTFSSESSNS